MSVHTHRDAVSLRAARLVLSDDLIVQVAKGMRARESSDKEAIREALREAMRRDERVFLLGQDIGKHGSLFGVTRTLFNEFGPELCCTARRVACASRLTISPAGRSPSRT